MLDYDIMEPFIVPDLLNEYDLDVEYFWGDLNKTGMNLFKHWSKISLQQATLFQRYFYDNCVNDEDIVSFEWTLELFVNSCDGALINSIE